MNMDLYALNILLSMFSAVMIIAAIVYMLYYLLGSFSSRSGAVESIRIVIFSLFYFFGSAIGLYLGVEWMTRLAYTRTAGGDVAFFLNIGASALALNAVIHFFCGFLTIFLYLRGKGYLGLHPRIGKRY